MSLYDIVDRVLFFLGDALGRFASALWLRFLSLTIAGRALATTVMLFGRRVGTGSGRRKPAREHSGFISPGPSWAFSSARSSFGTFGAGSRSRRSTAGRGQHFDSL